MQKRVEQVTGSFAMDLLSNLIDYKGDIARLESKTGNERVYSPDFSPNNIRRLILSGDGAVVYFHVPVSGRIFKAMTFSDLTINKIKASMCCSDYKPMLWALAQRVCSSVEEVIICTRNRSGVYLSKELNIEGLLKNKRTQGKSTEEEVLDRYTRLTYFAIINTEIDTIQRKVNLSECKECDYFICEQESIVPKGVATKLRNDWFNNYSSTSVYSMDRVGSVLNNHFKDIKTKMNTKSEDDAVSALRDIRTRDVLKRFNQLYLKYKGVYTCYTRVEKLLLIEGESRALDTGVEFKKADFLVKPEDFKERCNNVNSVREKSVVCDSIQKLITATYAHLLGYFLKSLSSVKLKYSELFDIFISQIDRVIAIPPEYQSFVTQLNVEFNGTSISDSMSNLCSYVCLMFLRDNGTHSVSVYYTKDAWIKYFEGSDTK